MEIELIIQELNQAASSGMLSNELIETLDEAVKTLNHFNAEVLEAEAEIDGGGMSWFYVCGECRSVINRWHKYCHECGRRLIWK